MVSFDITPYEMRVIDNIVDRASKEGLTDDVLSLEMDLVATNANGTPLDFDRLLAFDAFNFSHDITGITNYIDRTTGELTRCFVPRCAKREEATDADN